MTENDKELEASMLILSADDESWLKLGRAMGRLFRDDMSRHMLNSVEDRIRDGIKEEIRKREEEVKDEP